MTWSRRRLGALLAVTAVAAAACGAQAPHASPRSATASSTATGGPYSPDPAACGGRLPAATTVGAVTAGTKVVAVVACTDVRGLHVGRATTRQTTQLAAALAAPSKPRPPACDDLGTIPPAFVVRLSEGRWVHPAIPSDGCHPSEDVISLLVAVADQRD